MLQNTFTQKVMLTILAGFAAACLLWMVRHFVDQAFYESNEGWREMFNKTPPHTSR